MGFYYGSTPPRLSSEEIGPVITPREYTMLLAGAVRMVFPSTPPESDTYRPGTPRAAMTWGRIEGLSRRLRDHPDDATTHRMLAIAHLHAGHCIPAVRHLEIAVKMLLAQASTGCLQHSLSARVELALLLPVLVPLCLRLGTPATARQLVSKVLGVW